MKFYFSAKDKQEVAEDYQGPPQHTLWSSESNPQLEALSKHVSRLSECGLGQFSLHTLDGKSFAVLKDKEIVFRGTFAEVAEHCGFTQTCYHPTTRNEENCVVCAVCGETLIP